MSYLSVPKCEPLDELLNGEIVLSMPEDDGVNNNKTKVFFSCDAGGVGSTKIQYGDIASDLIGNGGKLVIIAADIISLQK